MLRLLSSMDMIDEVYFAIGIRITCAWDTVLCGHGVRAGGV